MADFLNRGDRFLRRGLDAVDLLADLAGGFGGLFGQSLYLGRHHGKAPPRLAGPRRLDGGVQRQQVGLPGDGVDEFDDIANPGRRLRRVRRCFSGRPHRTEELADLALEPAAFAGQ